MRPFRRIAFIGKKSIHKMRMYMYTCNFTTAYQVFLGVGQFAPPPEMDYDQFNYISNFRKP